MKVSYVTNLTNAVGGGGSNAERLCAAFDSRPEIDFVAIHASGTNAPETFWTDELGYRACFPKSLKDGIEQTDPDIVFVHGFNVSMIDWLRDHAADDDRIYTWRNGVNTLEQWLTLYNHGSGRKVTAPVYDLDFFDAIFAPSYAAGERLRFHYGSDCPHLSVAPCTIEYKKYVPTPFMEDNTLRIATASRVAPNNYILGPLLAVRRLIEQENLDVDMEIMSAGDRPYPDVIESVAADIDQVRIVGHLQTDEVQNHLEYADVVCVPSISQQAVPTIAVEAMAAGNVVLSADYHTVTEEDTLIRVPLDHIPSWWKALKDTAEHPDDANSRIKDGLEAAKGYDTEKVVNESYLPMFTMLMDEYKDG